MIKLICFLCFRRTAVDTTEDIIPNDDIIDPSNKVNAARINITKIILDAENKEYLTDEQIQLLKPAIKKWVFRRQWINRASKAEVNENTI